MTREEVKKQAVGRLKLSMRPEMLERAGQIADEILEPMAKRDQVVDDGKATVDAIDENGKHYTKEVQLHAPKRVRPYVYGPADVLSLERAIRRRMTP